MIINILYISNNYRALIILSFIILKANNKNPLKKGKLQFIANVFYSNLVRYRTIIVYGYYMVFLSCCLPHNVLSSNMHLPSHSTYWKEYVWVYCPKRNTLVRNISLHTNTFVLINFRFIYIYFRFIFS